MILHSRLLITLQVLFAAYWSLINSLSLILQCIKGWKKSKCCLLCWFKILASRVINFLLLSLAFYPWMQFPWAFFPIGADIFLEVQWDWCLTLKDFAMILWPYWVSSSKIVGWVCSSSCLLRPASCLCFSSACFHCSSSCFCSLSAFRKRFL